MNSLRDYLHGSAEKPLLSPTAERRLAGRARAGCKRSRDELVERNLRLVIGTAKKFRGLGLAFEDLIQEGNAGLITAADKFDPQMGYRFSTYAMWWIHQCVSRAVAKQSRTIKIPVHVSEHLRQISKAGSQFQAERGREPSIEELEERTGLCADAIRWARSVPKHQASLDAPLLVGRDHEEAAGSTLGSMIADAEQSEEVAGGRTEAYDLMVSLEAGRALQELPPRERWVVERYYGLDGRPPATLREIAREMGVVYQTVGGIKRRAMKRLSAVLGEHDQENRGLNEASLRLS